MPLISVIDLIDTDTLKSVYSKNLAKKFEGIELKKIEFKKTKSEIIQNNKCIIYCAKFPSLEGLFIKEKEATKKFGRQLCDFIKSEFLCNGFFTSDELPRYGIARKDVRYIFEKMQKKKGDGDLILLFAYDLEKASTINTFLVNYFKRALEI